MNQLKQTCGLIADNKTQEAVIAKLEVTIGSLLLNLQSIIPEKQAIFSELANDLIKTTSAIRFPTLNAVNYFSGNGPIAKKLKDHLALLKWSNSIISSKELKCRLDIEKFNFRPSTIPTEVNKLRDAIFTVGEQVRALHTNGALPVSKTGPMVGLHMFPTGMFTDGLNYFFLMVIEPFPDSAMKVMIAINYPDSIPLMTYYHPYEDIWMRDPNLITFTELDKQILEEFDLYLEKQSIAAEPFDFDKEVDQLQKRAGEVFDREEYLSRNCKYYQNHKDGYSLITIDYKGVLLTFRNTKGDYPSRIYTLTKFLPAGHFSIDPTDEQKSFLITIGHEVLGYLEKQIEENLRKVSTIQ